MKKYKRFYRYVFEYNRRVQQEMITAAVRATIGQLAAVTLIGLLVYALEG